MTKVRISTGAAEFIRAERAYIALYNKRASAKFFRQLRHLGKVLSEYPRIGEPVPADGEVRRFVTPPYIVEYEIHSRELVILMIRHGRQLADIAEDDDSGLEEG